MGFQPSSIPYPPNLLEEVLSEVEPSGYCAEGYRLLFFDYLL